MPSTPTASADALNLDTSKHNVNRRRLMWSTEPVAGGVQGPVPYLCPAAASVALPATAASLSATQPVRLPSVGEPMPGVPVKQS